MDATLTDTARAQLAMQWFSSYMSQYPQNYTFTYQELLDYITSNNPSFFQFYGKALRYAQETDVGISDATIKSGLESIADASQGTLPTAPGDWQVFYDALENQFATTNIGNWVRIAGATATATVQDVKQVAVIGGASALLLGAIALGVYLAVSRRI